MTLKTDFKRIEAFIEEAEAFPLDQGTLPRDKFLSIMDRCDILKAEVMSFIWYNKILNKEDRYDNLNDSKYLNYKDKVDILLEILYESREELIAQDQSLGNSAILIRSNQNHLISIISIPDDFYRKLIEEINILYDNNRYIPVYLLLRKLLENLIIDILRKKYGYNQINLFYNSSKGMFHNFSILLDNLKVNINEFKPIDPNFDEKIIKRIDFYRERGNSSSHSMSAEITKKEIDDKKEDINYLVMLMIRILNNIS